MALQALSGAVQPRALWVAAHHYELAPSMDSGWVHLLQALAMSFGAHDDDARTRRSLPPPNLEMHTIVLGLRRLSLCVGHTGLVANPAVLRTFFGTQDHAALQDRSSSDLA